jgi:hypothetical protein
MNITMPVILFAYARPDHLRQTVESLRANKVPLIYTFSDGPANPDKEPAVAEVRKILRGIDWCEVILCERDKNFGLGRSILDGISQVLSRHEAAIVFEDDLICVPGTYQYLASALNYYKDNPKVMSVTGWTHPRVIPNGVTSDPYFDGRAECWVWGTWARVWLDMNRDAKTLMQACEARGMDIYRYGADLPRIAEVELQQNIWAVRFLYLHILHGGLCLRPPHSMVEHIGFDTLATSATGANIWANPPLQSCPPLPKEWPDPVENTECPHLWQKAYGAKPVKPGLASWPRLGVRFIQRVITKADAVLRPKSGF